MIKNKPNISQVSNETKSKEHDISDSLYNTLKNNPSEQVQLKVVKQDGRVIQFIENPSEQVKITATKKN